MRAGKVPEVRIHHGRADEECGKGGRRRKCRGKIELRRSKKVDVGVTASALRPIAGLGLDYEAFGPGGQLEAAKAGDAHGDVGDEAEVVLAAKLVLNGLEDAIDGQGLRHFKAASAGFPGDAHEDTLAVGPAAEAH